MFKYGQIRPTDSQSHLFEDVRRLTDFCKAALSTSSSNAGTFCSSRLAVHSASGPFSHSGIGELKPILRRPIRMSSGILPCIARRAIHLVCELEDLLAPGSAIV